MISGSTNDIQTHFRRKMKNEKRETKQNTSQEKKWEGDEQPEEGASIKYEK